jgi:hypothetical protein
VGKWQLLRVLYKTHKTFFDLSPVAIRQMASIEIELSCNVLTE